MPLSREQPSSAVQASACSPLTHARSSFRSKNHRAGVACSVTQVLQTPACFQRPLCVWTVHSSRSPGGHACQNLRCGGRLPVQQHRQRLLCQRVAAAQHHFLWPAAAQDIRRTATSGYLHISTLRSWPACILSRKTAHCDGSGQQPHLPACLQRFLHYRTPLRQEMAIRLLSERVNLTKKARRSGAAPLHLSWVWRFAFPALLSGAAGAIAMPGRRGRRRRQLNQKPAPVPPDHVVMLPVGG